MGRSVESLKFSIENIDGENLSFSPPVYNMKKYGIFMQKLLKFFYTRFQFSTYSEIINYLADLAKENRITLPETSLKERQLMFGNIYKCEAYAEAIFFGNKKTKHKKLKIE